MNPGDGALSLALQQIHVTTMGWANVIQPFCEGNYIDFLQIAIFFLGLSLIFLGHPGALVIRTVLFMIEGGFGLAMIRHGSEWLASWFVGVQRLGEYLGCPPLDPSSVIEWGTHAAAPITASLAKQGYFSYALNPASWVGWLAEMAVWLSFATLAFMLSGLLVFSWLLIQMTPFFWCFFAFGPLRTLTKAHINLSLGCMAGLFSVELIMAMVSNLADLLEQQFRTHFAVGGVSFGSSEYLSIFGVGLILLGIFIWFPYEITRSVGGHIPSWEPAFQALHAGGSIVSATYSGGSSVGRVLSSGGASASQMSTGGSSGGSSSIGASGGAPAQPLPAAKFGVRS